MVSKLATQMALIRLEITSPRLAGGIPETHSAYEEMLVSKLLPRV